MRWLAILLTLAGCVPAAAPAVRGRAMRIVSLDYCADQYVLRFADRGRIVALSPYAEADESYMRAAARGIRKVRPNAEEVLALAPDLVVRSFGGGAQVEGVLTRAGVPVLQLAPAEDLGGVRAELLRLSAALGAAGEGQRMAHDMDARLAAILPGRSDRNALYLTPGGVTSGTGTLIDTLFRTAGLANFQTAHGWASLPLERLAYERPDVVATAFFDTRWNRADAWSASGHPIVTQLLAKRPKTALPSAWTACGGWYLVDAVEALAKAAR